MENNELFSLIKGVLKVTWDSQDEEITELVSEGKTVIQSKCGELDFLEHSTVPILSRKLLKEYCRYSWNGSAAYFEADYRSDLLNLQIAAAMERAKDETTD